ncbi:Flp pilus assembly protein CpaB [Stagnimonas aquatica]|uniref:Flp pilus assembly protein CpaB n=1 Tax=Stagnimonas aquatica TaxID=2689987 RepID=A0A3N0VLM6_9GAMM|nr:Flp pilus assembly protein CpaB [Stagnimonas aquatica]ROH92988.1 Flp pilus assembly protein CpaB [Stagnimonas aquatica]
MSSTALKVAAVILVLLTVVLAALGFSMSRNYAARAAKAEADAAKVVGQQAPQTLAVVALKPLAAYKTIARDDVSLVPVVVTPTDYYANLDEVVGRVPLVDVDAGAPITHRYFKEGNILAKVIPAGHQALALEVNEVVATGGFVRPGDNVDVLVYFRGGAGVNDAQSRVLLENARVLAFEERIIERPEGLKDDEKQDASRRRQRTAVIAVPDKDTTRVMLGVSLGDVRLALRGQQTATSEEAPAELTEAGLPLSETAKSAEKDQKVPDKAITAAELSRVKPPPALEKKLAPPAVVEVIQGSQITKVSQ